MGGRMRRKPPFQAPHPTRMGHQRFGDGHNLPLSPPLLRRRWKMVCRPPD